MSALIVLRMYKITPSNMHSALVNRFDISELIDSLEQYKLLYWAPQHFFAQLKEGMIERNGVEYLVVYHKCTPTRLHSQSQIALSFRQAKIEFNLPAYVLVSI